MSEQSFGYSLAVAGNLAMMIGSGIVAVGSAILALTHQGTLALGDYTLSDLGTRLVFGLVAFITAFAAIRTGRDWWHPVRQRLQIRLESDGIVGPAHPEQPGLLKLSYKGISDVKTKLVNGTRYLVIKHMDGNMHISSEHLDGFEEFEMLWRAIEARVGLHRGYRY